MQDPRYKKTRQALDQLKFLDHLGADSVDLVEKILGQYTKVLELHNKLKKKINNEPKADVANYEHQIDLLNEKYGKLMEENERLRKKMDEGGVQQKIMALESALNSCRVKYEQKLDEMNDKVTKYQFQIQELSIAKASLTEQNQRIRSMLEKSKYDSDNATNELTSILDKKKKEIQRLEQENSKYRLQVNSLERIYQEERQVKSVTKLESQTKITLTMQVLKEQLASAEEKLEQAKLQIQSQRRLNEELNTNVKNLQGKINQLRSQEDYAKNSYHLESNAKSKFESLYAESQNKIEEQREKISQLEQAKNELEQEISRLNEKVKELMGKNKTIMGNMGRIQEELAVLNNNYTSKVRELREAENQKATLDRKIKDLQLSLRQSEERGESDSRVDSGSLKMSQQYEKKQAILEKQIQITQNQLRIMQENEHQILSEKAKVETEVKKLQLVIGEGNKQIQLIQMQKENLMKENKELKSHLSSTQTESFSSKSETVRLQETIDQYQIMIQDLRIALRNEQNVSKTFAQKAGEFEKAVSQQIENNKQIFEDNKQLKLMVGSLEKIKADLFEKYKSCHEEKAGKEEDRIEYIKEYNKLLEENKQVLEKLRRKESALSELNNEYDSLQNTLDNKTEENFRLQQKIQRLEKELASFDRGIDERQMSLQGQQNHIRSLEREIQKVQAAFAIKCQEISNYETALNRSMLDAQSLNNEVSLLVKSNKEYEKSIERDKIKLAEIERKLKERIKEVDELRQTNSAFKIQNLALIDEVKRTKEEQVNMQNYSNHVVQQYNSLYNNFMQKQMEMKELQEAVTHFQFQETQYSSQIVHYQKQLRALGDEMIKKQEEIKRLMSDRDVYRAEANASRRNLSASSIDWKSVLQQRIQSLQSEISIKKMECESHRNQARSLAKLIEEQRQKNYYLEQQIKKSKANDTQTPIKMFYKSRVESENWNGYNRDLTDLDKNSEMGKSSNFSKYSRDIQESRDIERESIVSIQSKKLKENLEEIQRKYNQLNITKIRK